MTPKQQDTFWGLVSPLVQQWLDTPYGNRLLEKINKPTYLYKYLPVLSSCAPVWRLFPRQHILNYVQNSNFAIAREIAERYATDVLIIID